jgi:hypothetical protein
VVGQSVQHRAGTTSVAGLGLPVRMCGI